MERRSVMWVFEIWWPSVWSEEEFGVWCPRTRTDAITQFFVDSQYEKTQSMWKKKVKSLGIKHRRGRERLSSGMRCVLDDGGFIFFGGGVRRNDSGSWWTTVKMGRWLDPTGSFRWIWMNPVYWWGPPEAAVWLWFACTPCIRPS